MMIVPSLACGVTLLALPGPEYAPTPAPAVNTIGLAARDVSDLVREFRKADRPELRINVLNKIAAVPVSPEEPNAVVNALGRGLEDDSFLVAARAAELLGKRATNDVALDLLVEACGDLEKARKSAFDGLDKMSNVVPELGDKHFAEDLEKLGQLLDEKRAILEGLHAYESALLVAVLERRDDRCVGALADLMKVHLFGGSAWPIVEGLFSIGTAPAIEEVIDLFRDSEKRIDEREKERKKLARQRPERVPKMWKGTKDAWKNREVNRINAAVDRFDKTTDGLRAWRLELSTRVQKLARSANLALPPSTADVDGWEDWWRERRGSLPKSLVD